MRSESDLCLPCRRHATKPPGRRNVFLSDKLMNMNRTSRQLGLPIFRENFRCNCRRRSQNLSSHFEARLKRTAWCSYRWYSVDIRLLKAQLKSNHVERCAPTPFSIKNAGQGDLNPISLAIVKDVRRKSLRQPRLPISYRCLTNALGCSQNWKNFLDQDRPRTGKVTLDLSTESTLWKDVFRNDVAIWSTNVD